MILVNDNWEQIYDLQDVSKIIREYYNRDLADELDKLIPEHTDEEYYDLESQLSDKDFEISNLEDEISYKDGLLDEKDEEIENLEKKISELEEYKSMYEDLCK